MHLHFINSLYLFHIYSNEAIKFVRFTSIYGRSKVYALYPNKYTAFTMVNILIIWGLIILFIVQPDVTHSGAEIGAQLFTHALLPYLLPYIILTQWLLKMPNSAQNVVSWKGFLKAYVLGSFGGFPVGAVTLSEMTKNKELSKRQASWLLAACHAPGPMFIIGFVGTELFNNIQLGWKLLAAIHSANILFFFLTLRFSLKKSSGNENTTLAIQKQEDAPLLSAIKESSSIIILVATTVIFFSALGTVLSHLIESVFAVDTGITQTFVLSIFEMTTGVQSATNHFSGRFIYPLIVATIVSMNGLSIHMQVAVIAKSAGLSIRPYIAGRLWSICAVPVIFYFLL